MATPINAAMAKTAMITAIATTTPGMAGRGDSCVAALATMAATEGGAPDVGGAVTSERMGTDRSIGEAMPAGPGFVGETTGVTGGCPAGVVGGGGGGTGGVVGEGGDDGVGVDAVAGAGSSHTTHVATEVSFQVSHLTQRHDGKAPAMGD